MNRIPTRLTALLLAVGGLMSTGCVSQRSHDDLLRINRQLEERRVDLEQQLAAKEQAIRDLQRQMATMNSQQGENAALRQRLAEEQQTIADLRREIAALRAEIADLGDGVGPIVIVDQALPPEISDALRDLAAANADLMEYDAARGMIRLRSDLTFALGSATVSDQAKTALGRLANVLNGGAASKFDIQVIGHTDAVPVTSAQGKQLYIDNRGLSSNRGDAVARVLIGNGVSASRIMSGGRGATQPIEPNNAKGQSKANRRVEIFIVKASEENAGARGGGGAVQPPRDVTIRPAGGVIEGGSEPVDDSVFK